jgi:NADP-dependent 3-hydroxy acid dehydrogenase YdfG
VRALVTGVTRGIGHALVGHLVERGAVVAAVARNEAALAREAQQWGGAVHPYVADVNDAAAMQAVVDSFGPVDLAVANAGALVGTGPLWEADPDEWWAGVEVNVRGVFHTLRAVLPGMLERGSGRIVLLTSGLGNSPGSYISGYAASKAAVTTLGASVQQELAGTGVGCFLVSPGMVRTDMTRFPESLTRHKPFLADIPEEHFTPVERLLELVDEIAAGELDALAGRFLHATDDRAALLAAVDAADARPRTLRLAPAHEGDPQAR